MHKLFNYELLQRSITALLLSCIVLWIFFLMPYWCFSLMLFIALFYIIIFEMPKIVPYKGISFWLLVGFYIIVPFMMIITLNHHQEYRTLILLSLLAACSNDIGAYCIGKLWGKHKIAPSISPKKTWEGFIGGLLLTGFMLICWKLVMHKNISFSYILMLSLIFSILGTVGDFFESWLKRKAHIKDSGQLLPGHGGLLDRVDSLLFIIIFVFFCKELLAKKFL